MPNPWEADPLFNPPPVQADVRKVDNYFAERDSTLSKLASIRKLNTQDKSLAQQIYLSPAEIAADKANDKSPENLTELSGEIARQKNPALKKILQDEYNKLTFGNILGMN